MGLIHVCGLDRVAPAFRDRRDEHGRSARGGGGRIAIRHYDDVINTAGETEAAAVPIRL